MNRKPNAFDKSQSSSRYLWLIVCAPRRLCQVNGCHKWANKRFCNAHFHTVSRHPLRIIANENPVAAVSPLWIACLCYAALCDCQGLVWWHRAFAFAPRLPLEGLPYGSAVPIPFAHRLWGAKGGGGGGHRISIGVSSQLSSLPSLKSPFPPSPDLPRSPQSHQIPERLLWFMLFYLYLGGILGL